MKEPVTIGAVLILRNSSSEEIRERVRQMADCGIEIIRSFVHWDFVEPREGDYDFSLCDACFAAAEEAGLKISFTLPRTISPPGWMRATIHYQANLQEYENPEILQRGVELVKKLVNRYRTSPALHSWWLENEPRMSSAPRCTEHELRLYREFLQEHYGNDIEALNRNYHFKFADFAEITPEVFARIDPSQFMGYTEVMDFHRFKIRLLLRRIGSIKKAILNMDTGHPIHANPASLDSNNGSAELNAVWEETEFFDFIGCSSYACWSVHTPQESILAFCSDLMRSVTRDADGLFWASEVQGGASIFRANTPLTPDASDLKLWLWDCYGAGARSVNLWSFNQCWRGEWALLDQLGRTSWRTRAVGEIAKLLQDNRALFDGVSPAPPDVYVLHSVDTCLHDLNIRDKNRHVNALKGAYFYFADRGYEVYFTTEKRIVAGELPRGAVLVAPSCTVLSKETLRALEAFVREGGRLVADDFFGWKNGYGVVERENLALAGEFCGASLKDVDTVRPDTVLRAKDGSEPFPAGYYARVEFEDTDAVVQTYGGGVPAILYHRHGRGSVLRIGTTVFEACNQDPSLELPLPADVMPSRASPFRLVNAARGFRLRRLPGDNGGVAVLINYGEGRVATISAEADLTFRDLETGEIANVAAGKTVQLGIPSRSVRIFEYHPR